MITFCMEALTGINVFLRNYEISKYTRNCYVKGKYLIIISTTTRGLVHEIKKAAIISERLSLSFKVNPPSFFCINARLGCSYDDT